MITFKPEVLAFFAQLKRGAYRLLQLLKGEKTGLPGSTAASVRPDPLRLNLQFFAEGDPPPPAPDGFFPTLKDVFKTNPHLQTEHKTAITNAVSERFKNYDFDAEEAKQAMKEKRERDAAKAAGTDVESAEMKTLKETNAKLSAKTKQLALARVVGDEEQTKLISRLAAEKVAALNLNDAFDLDADAVKGIVKELSEEFPNLFPVEDPAADPNAAPDPNGTVPPVVPPVKVPGFNAGSLQRTNTPPAPDNDPTASVAATLEKLRKTKRI